MVETQVADQTYNWIMLLVMYIVLNVVRFLMDMLFAPILTRMGGGLSMKEAVIVGYSGLRGAVSLSLALIANHTTKDRTYAAQVLFLISGLIA